MRTGCSTPPAFSVVSVRPPASVGHCGATDAVDGTAVESGAAAAVEGADVAATVVGVEVVVAGAADAVVRAGAVDADPDVAAESSSLQAADKRTAATITP